MKIEIKEIELVDRNKLVKFYTTIILPKPYSYNELRKLVKSFEIKSNETNTEFRTFIKINSYIGLRSIFSHEDLIVCSDNFEPLNKYFKYNKIILLIHPMSFVNVENRIYKRNLKKYYNEFCKKLK